MRELRVTVTNILAQSYLPATSESFGKAAKAAGERKMAEYEQLAQSYQFAVETLGPINKGGLDFLIDRPWKTHFSSA